MQIPLIVIRYGVYILVYKGIILSSIISGIIYQLPHRFNNYIVESQQKKLIKFVKLEIFKAAVQALELEPIHIGI